jgi:hypothetical protein
MKGRYAFFAVIFVISILSGIQAIEVVNTNPTTLSWFRITIASPKDTTYYSTKTILLNVTVEINEIDSGNTSYYYNLDNNSNVKFMETKGQGFGEFNGTYYVNGSVVLPSLSIGNHNVTVFRGVNGSNGLLTIIGTPAIAYFSIQKAPFPMILILAPIGTIAVLSVVLLVYFRRRRGKL